jgi:hypothetical protein
MPTFYSDWRFHCLVWPVDFVVMVKDECLWHDILNLVHACFTYLDWLEFIFPYETAIARMMDDVCPDDYG